MAHEMRRADEADNLDILRRDRPNRYAIFQPLSETIPVCEVQVCVSNRPLFGVAFAGPDQQRIFKGSDGPFPVLRALAGKALPVSNAEVEASCCPIVGIPGRRPD